MAATASRTEKLSDAAPEPKPPGVGTKTGQTVELAVKHVEPQPT